MDEKVTYKSIPSKGKRAYEQYNYDTASGACDCQCGL